jgi:chromosome segregation ATPase
MLFASPRVAVKIQYDKAKKLMDDAAAEVAAGEMEMARIEKAIEKATAAVEAAKVPLEKARNTSQAALERVKSIKANWDTLPQRTRAQQQAKADQDLERALRAAGEATDNFKDKEAVVKELGKELKEAEKALKPLRTKFEAQQKAVQALEQKL